MKTIVITGSSRGIGKGLAERFLEEGHNVVISGRTRDNLERTFRELKGKFQGDRVHAVLCDVSISQDHENLWNEAFKRFGRVDIWINNAGVGQPHLCFEKLDPENMRRIVETNIAGVMYGTYTAFRRMEAQGGGQIYNMEGFGSSGAKMAGMTVYGTSKRAVNYFNSSFMMETKNSSVLTGAIAPGMVLTDFILEPVRANPEIKKRMAFVLNAIAGEVGPVTAFIAKKILANKKHGIRINYTGPVKAFFGFAAAGFGKRGLAEKYLN